MCLSTCFLLCLPFALFSFCLQFSTLFLLSLLLSYFILLNLINFCCLTYYLLQNEHQLCCVAMLRVLFCFFCFFILLLAKTSKQLVDFQKQGKEGSGIRFLSYSRDSLLYSASLLSGGSSLWMLCGFEEMHKLSCESEPKTRMKTSLMTFHPNFSSLGKTSKTPQWKLADGDYKQSTAQIVPQILAEHTHILPKLPSLTKRSRWLCSHEDPMCAKQMPFFGSIFFLVSSFLRNLTNSTGTNCSYSSDG